MEKNTLISNLPVFMIGSFGHSGIDWVHSLLDSHSQILIMPAFSYFRTLEKIKREKKINIYKTSNLEISKTISNMFYLDKAYQSSERKFLNNKIDKNNFELYLQQYLISQRNNNKIKNIFYGIHFAYAKLYNIDLNKKKILISHEHVSWHCEEYKKYFNSKFIIIFRDPRASLGGGILKMRNFNFDKKLNSFQFDTMLLTMFSAYNFLNKNKEIVYPLINELMHKNLKKEMSNLSNWLKIDYYDSMLNQTRMNEKIYSDSAYLNENKQILAKDFYEITNVEKRWRSVLSTKEILFIEVIFRKMMFSFNFKKDNELYFLNILKGYFYCHFLHLHQNKYKSIKIIVFLRNLIRRMLILSLGAKTKYFFNFK